MVIQRDQAIRLVDTTFSRFAFLVRDGSGLSNTSTPLTTPTMPLSTLAERLDEPLANMTRLMYDIGSRGSWDETCGVVEVA